MAEPFLGELKLVSFNFAPKGWAMCNGLFLPINQNQALFALLGTTFGGNGQTTFSLPDLRGRVPLHFGSSFTIGQVGGQEAHTLTQSEMPAHNHFAQGINAAANSAAPVANGRLANSSPQKLYGPFSAVQAMHPASLLNVGGSQPHQNMQPYLVLTWIIALQGIFPSRN
jgi:microcystin-dependent protein